MNNAAMKHRTDLNLGDVFCLSITYHTLDSWLNLLNGYDFYFLCKRNHQFRFRIPVFQFSKLPFDDNDDDDDEFKFV